jgi:NAD dependent epimerase/dehydratase family enzyme
MFGEMGRETLLGGVRVRPGFLLERGFQFECPELEGALRGELGPGAGR